MFKCFLFILTICLSNIGFSQHLSGIWKGYFTTGFGDHKQYYKYEVQIQQDSHNINGVAYSYLNKEFYGKTKLVGQYDFETKKIQAKETQLLHFANESITNVCLMHNTLTYLKIDKNKEVLEGTFTSVNSVSGNACAEGYVYLERAINSDFHKETFLIAKSPLAKNKISRKHSNYIIAAKQKNKTIHSLAPRSTLPKDSILPEKDPIAASKITADDVTMDRPDIPSVPTINSFNSIPEIFQNRKNKLVKTIITHTPEVDISFYDNGEVDDDSITVYHNLIPTIQHGRLSRKPIEYGFDASNNNRLQSFIIVADNLGKIPPNSALMVIYTNKERYEIFIESDLKNNGEVRIIYEPLKTK